MNVLVLGSRGFVGTAVCAALREQGHDVTTAVAPRVQTDEISAAQREQFVGEIQAALGGCDAVVNAAGVPDATGSDYDAMVGANTVLPGIVAEAARRLGLRCVHVSSAAVQGDKEVLDSSDDVRPFSPYSESKVRGEREALQQGGEVVVYRPPGVHGANRDVTRTVARLAGSPLSSVAGDGSHPAAQALIGNVGAAVATLATHPDTPPRVVHHPWEGQTTASLLRALGGREPVHLPSALARGLVEVARAAGRVRPGLAGHARRLEVLWFGQSQAPSWLDSIQWVAPDGRESWEALGRSIRTSNKETHD
ncbi:NAD(P)-dependent oxidoreductase [Kytococcus sedentarius]|uniref:Nucleoside-diphosphate-sugar epimerase n=1 Tax=Kytococcus sedentarius (strain ATCC 14392 / DSM 20547 / JCM 11482 / CCUG 33030 / NBRC 15357 / NCTC 11040 / CCM 314 / 541) TaxID=478801 RepID=C7NJT1_KYTSD|nr:NAD(P)-dependent oxidoreductase [Kytococcus sedentarius]ACV06863.1 nucleoside-diphosphate-sugar epimerase [Kytococcus sedentarius DSM 20547]QQB62881.1 NAD(P)-dependent oxidoreductase [Kytococcus sedentarius]STX14312.1 Putative NADH-flavin reductase [Kytococcus sedentarius]